MDHIFWDIEAITEVCHFVMIDGQIGQIKLLSPLNVGERRPLTYSVQNTFTVYIISNFLK